MHLRKCSLEKGAFSLREDVAGNRQCHLQKRHLQNSNTYALWKKTHSYLLLLTVLIAGLATNLSDKLYALEKEKK